MRGPMSGQISSQTLSDLEPRTQSRLMPTVGRYASLQKNLRFGPQAIHIAYRDVNTIRTTVLRLWGHEPGARRSVDAKSKCRIIDAISPDPAKKSGPPRLSTAGYGVSIIQ